ncbi:hypothetical protein GCM10027053_41530 [Intrasporangium mesophilum]
MSAIVVEAAHRQQAQGALCDPLPSPRGRGHLVLVPTGPDALGPASRAHSRLRLTRRGRLVIALLVAAVVAVLGVAAAVQRAGAVSEPRVITVQPGQTLWGIASRELPDLPVTSGIVELQLANSLSTSQIHIGQRLVIPTP